jgi:hypothetical protein
MGKLEGKKDGSVSILLDRMGSGLYSPNIKWLVPNFQGTGLDALPHWLEPQQSTASKQLVVPQLLLITSSGALLKYKLFG